MITPLQIQAIMLCTPQVAQKWADCLNAAAIKYGAVENYELAMWLAQIGHETGGLKWLREIWGPTRAQRGYEGRRDLGNTHPGDGKKYMGRGPFMLTGRANYAKFTEAMQEQFPGCPDFVEQPELVELPGWGALSAAHFWAERPGLERTALKGDLKGNTRIVNGGLNGLTFPPKFSRKACYARALKAFGLRPLM